MTDQVAPSPQSLCDHPVYVHHVRGGEPLTIPICQLCGEIGWDDLREQVAEHRRTVLTDAEAAIEDARSGWPDGHTVTIGYDEAIEVVRRLAAAAPPAGLSAPVPAENAPAVPEEADGQRATEGVDYGPCPHTEALGQLHLEWLAEVADLKAERDALRLAAQVEQIRALHAPKPCPKGCDHCAHCGPKYAWPCPTIAAVDALPDAATDQTEDDRGV